MSKQLSVIGRNFYPGYELKIYIHKFDSDNPNIGFGDRYRCINLTEGNAIIQINNHIYPVTAPVACCLNEKDQIHILSNHGLKGSCLLFHPSVIHLTLNYQEIWSSDKSIFSSGSLDYWCLKPFIMKNSDYNGLLPLDPSLSKRISALIEMMTTLAVDQPDDGWPCRCRSFLIEQLFVFSRLFDCSKLEDFSQFNLAAESVRPVVLYLTKNYNRKIKLEELTKVFHLNKTTLNERFKKATGTSVMSYLITLRMQIACSMLKNTTVPISEIAQRVGFIDDAHFLRSFKKHTGLAPTEYRNINCWMLHQNII